MADSPDVLDLAGSYWYVPPGTGNDSEPVDPVLVAVDASRTLVEVAPPKQVLGTVSFPDEPVWGRGLMLYAQTDAELHWPTPDGPVIGVVHKGSLLAIGHEVADSFPVATPFDMYFEGRPSPLVGYVHRGNLGVSEQEQNLTAHPAGMPIVWPPASYQIEAASGVSASVHFDLCTEVWVSDYPHASQLLDGVEINAFSEFPSSVFWDHGPRTYHSSTCPVPVLVRSGPHLVLIRHRQKPRTTTTVPLDFREVTLNAANLEDVIFHGRSVFWMTTEKQTLVCEEWRFRNVSTAKIGDLVRTTARLERQRDMNDFPFRWYPATYSHESGHLPQLTLDYTRPNPWKGEFPYSYTVLRDDPDVAFITTARLPENLVAFAQGDVERWFYSRAACEAAATTSIAVLKADPAWATHLGTHIKEGWLR